MRIEKGRIKEILIKQYYSEIEESIMSGKLKKRKVGKKYVYRTKKTFSDPLTGEKWGEPVEARGENAFELAENLAEKAVNCLYPNYNLNNKPITGLTFTDVCDEWVEKELPKRKNKSNGKPLTHKSIGQYLNYAKMLKESPLGSIPVSKITLNDINSFIFDRFEGKAKTPYTYTKTIIVNSLAYAKYRGYIEKLPFSNNTYDKYEQIYMPTFKETREKNVIEENGLSLYAKGAGLIHGGLLIVIALLTGIRPSELIRLQWGDIIFDEKRIKIDRSRTKSKAGARFIPIPDWLVDELKREYGNAQEFEKNNGCKCENVFHVKMNYAKPYNQNTLKNFWSDYLDIVDLTNGAIVYRNQIIYSNFDFQNSAIEGDNTNMLLTYRARKSVTNRKAFDDKNPNFVFESKMIPYISPDCMRHTFKSYGSTMISDFNMRKIFGHTTGTADDNYEHQIFGITKEEKQRYDDYMQEHFVKEYFVAKSIAEDFTQVLVNIVFKNENHAIVDYGIDAIYVISNGKKYKVKINNIIKENEKISVRYNVYDSFDSFKKKPIIKDKIFMNYEEKYEILCQKWHTKI